MPLKTVQPTSDQPQYLHLKTLDQYRFLHHQKGVQGFIFIFTADGGFNKIPLTLKPLERV